MKRKTFKVRWYSFWFMRLRGYKFAGTMTGPEGLISISFFKEERSRNA